jgi:hypothetical protein
LLQRDGLSLEMVLLRFLLGSGIVSTRSRASSDLQGTSFTQCPCLETMKVSIGLTVSNKLEIGCQIINKFDYKSVLTC